MNSSDTADVVAHRSKFLSTLCTPYAAAMFCLFCIFLLLWTYVASGELAIDELWSVWLLNNPVKLSTPLDIIVNKHDNNHPLNSLWQYFCSLHGLGSPLARRMMSLLASALTFWTLWHLCLRSFGKLPAFVACLAFTFSYLPLELMTEARGYGLMILFITLSLDVFIALKSPHAPRWLLPIYWGLSILSVLAHNSSSMYIGLLALADSFSEQWKHKKIRRTLFVVLKRHGIPLLFCIAWILFFFSGMYIGYNGEKNENTGLIFLDFISTMSGLRPVMTYPALAFVSFLFICVSLLLSTAKNKTLLTFVSLCLLIGIPATVIFVFKPPFLFARHFSPLVPFFFIFVACLTKHAVDFFLSHKYAISAAIALIPLCIVIGNIPCLIDLSKNDRGQFGASLDFILKTDSRPQIIIGSNGGFASDRLLESAISNSSNPSRFKLIPSFNPLGGSDEFNDIDPSSNYLYMIDYGEPPSDIPESTLYDGFNRKWDLIFSGFPPPLIGLYFVLYKRQE